MRSDIQQPSARHVLILRSLELTYPTELHNAAALTSSKLKPINPVTRFFDLFAKNIKVGPFAKVCQTYRHFVACRVVGVRAFQMCGSRQPQDQNTRKQAKPVLSTLHIAMFVAACLYLPENEITSFWYYLSSTHGALRLLPRIETREIWPC